MIIVYYRYIVICDKYSEGYCVLKILIVLKSLLLVCIIIKKYFEIDFK